MKQQQQQLPLQKTRNCNKITSFLYSESEINLHYVIVVNFKICNCTLENNSLQKYFSIFNKIFKIFRLISSYFCHDPIITQSLYDLSIFIYKLQFLTTVFDLYEIILYAICF